MPAQPVLQVSERVWAIISQVQGAGFSSVLFAARDHLPGCVIDTIDGSPKLTAESLRQVTTDLGFKPQDVRRTSWILVVLVRGRVRHLRGRPSGHVDEIEDTVLDVELPAALQSPLVQEIKITQIVLVQVLVHVAGLVNH